MGASRAISIVVLLAASVVGINGAVSGAPTVLARGTPGAVDRKFGQDGIVTTPIESSAWVQAVELARANRIVVAGNARAGSTTSIALASYRPNGSPDTSFGHNGIVTTTVASSNASSNAAVVGADGKIVVAGQSGNRFVLLRYHENGTLDQTFGQHGIART